MSSSTASTIDRTDNARAWESLVTRSARGDERALAQLYDSTNRLVYGMALRILGDVSSAEDVTTEVYLQVWRTAESYDPRRGTVSAWLVALVRTRAIACLRSRKARRAELEDVEDVVDLRESRPRPELMSAEAGRSRASRRALGDLARDQREAIELAYFSGFSQNEIVARSGLPFGTVKTRIRLGMSHLREILGFYTEAL